MSILKTNTKKKASKIIGAMMSLSVSDYLSLYTVAKEQTKSKILKQLVDSFIAEQKMKYSEKDLIKEISGRIEELRKIEIRKGDFKYNDFKEQIEKDLLAKGLNEVHTQLILKMV